MGLERFIKGRQINMIQWDRLDTKDIYFCFNEKLEDIRIGSKLNVPKGQIAFIVEDHQEKDFFKEGTYYLDEKAMPLMMESYKGEDCDLKNFKAKLFFVSIGPYVCQWPNDYSLTVTDSSYGNINIKIQGDYSVKVVDTSLFSHFLLESYNNLTENHHSPMKKMEAILEEQLGMIFGGSLFTFEEIYDGSKTISEKLSKNLNIKLKDIGLNLDHLDIISIELPDTVSRIIEEKLEKEHLMGKVDRVKVRTCNTCGIVLSKEAQFCAQCGAIYTK